jgi:hypothetical protein
MTHERTGSQTILLATNLTYLAQFTNFLSMNPVIIMGTVWFFMLALVGITLIYESFRNEQ